MDRRQHPRTRFRFSVPVRIVGPRAHLEGQLLDISPAGACLELPQLAQWPGGDRLTCEFDLAGEAYRVNALVLEALPGSLRLRFEEDAALQLALGEALGRLVREASGASQVVHASGRLKVRGAFNIRDRKDVRAGLARFQAQSIDLSEVTAMDTAAMAMCFLAREEHGAEVARCSPSAREMLWAVNFCLQCPSREACHKGRRVPAGG